MSEKKGCFVVEKEENSRPNIAACHIRLEGIDILFCERVTFGSSSVIWSRRFAASSNRSADRRNGIEQHLDCGVEPVARLIHQYGDETVEARRFLSRQISIRNGSQADTARKTRVFLAGGDG